MGDFKRTTTTKGTLKNICVHEGSFMDSETGDVVDLAAIFEKIYGEDVDFTLTTTLKTDEDLDV